MTINRRTVIRQLALLSATAAILPSCLGDRSKPDLVLKNFTLDGAGQRTLDRLAATLIPTTDTPGASETGAALFMLKMLDDCSSKADQDRFFKGLHQLDDASRNMYGAAFADATAGQREAVLTAIGDRKIPGEALDFFYSTARRLTILSYTSSSWFLTKVQLYELVPGRWHGCWPMGQSQKSSL
ncbi:MAG TPA: gluconate 2-dehydrogenase subunit 3 family protein [Puia sp.]|nr:gluconate 2-dehydrogenase subunit 3 family protein [Puia sp.]